MKIQEIRRRINRLDEKLLLLLNRRAHWARLIGRLKGKKERAVYDPARESQLVRRLLAHNQGPLDRDELRNIYREVLSACRRLQGDLKIAYLGPEATFSHEAALKRFGLSAGYLPVKSIPGIFRRIEDRQADYGVVPVENSRAGVVSYTLDMFIDSDLKICSELYLNISHSLLSRGPLSRIEKIYSHPQVFSQCRNWLAQHLPEAELIEMPSTAAAARQAGGEKGSAAIAGTLAGRIYKLKVRAEKIEDSSHNITRFLVIGPDIPPASGRDRTSILFALSHRSGALQEALLPFKKREINLTAIQSRPSRNKPWEYYFYVDFEGHYQNRKVKTVLDELSKHCLFVKVLGSYPRA